VAVGCRGLGTLHRMRFGSVSTAVLRGADGPVLITPHPHHADKETAPAALHVVNR
jgi:nucleotide-binding universal stress UspA family protein